MIRLKAVPKPGYLESNQVLEAIAANRAAIANGDRPTFPTFWNEAAVRQALHERHHGGKCCYTERRRDIMLERDVEHFRPKARIVGEADHPGYWWLAYDWDNLLVACKINNTINKGNRFPLRPGGRRAFLEVDSLEQERPVLINPAIEDPAEFITFHWGKAGGRHFCKPVPSFDDVDGRGKETIETVGIDRKELMGEEERAECGKSLERLAIEALTARTQMRRAADIVTQQLFTEQFERFKREIFSETAAERTFAGARRAFFTHKYDLAECVCND
jgi:uncharacterized protein (TIGR02646 family)